MVGISSQGGEAAVAGVAMICIMELPRGSLQGIPAVKAADLC